MKPGRNRPICIRIFDPDGRCPEIEREFPTLDMVAMTAIEEALGIGRKVEIENARGRDANEC